MDFRSYFYTIFALMVSQVLASNSRHRLPAVYRYTNDHAELGIPVPSFEKPLHQFGRRTSSEAENSDEKVKESMSHKPDLTWWPSKFDFFDSINEIKKSTSASLVRETTRKPATFEELENRNANRYNPFLNLDHYPIPSKKYTFEELENMNANQYNPYLNYK